MLNFKDSSHSLYIFLTHAEPSFELIFLSYRVLKFEDGGGVYSIRNLIEFNVIINFHGFHEF